LCFNIDQLFSVSMQKNFILMAFSYLLLLQIEKVKLIHVLLQLNQA
jgi:hypothetical protein